MFHNHPKIEVSPSDLDKRAIKWGWGIIVLNFLVVLWFYFDLPDKIPLHFNIEGEVNGYGNKLELWILPALNLIVYYIIAVFTFKIKPYKMNFPTKVTEKSAPILYRMALTTMAWTGVITALLLFLVSIEVILRASQIDSFSLFYPINALVLLLLFGSFYIIYKMIKVPKS
ncbi:DUF1648 domain-containing protein [Flagellimonas allohymeniacidonis]|uniref:DUF1648 domain-containing protein n=1 Tax=Flagellimonas allohymeniacidonis TaxID=2517819 RepID=A0A4Q8QJW7_9FLAO|nr:DUF1648 domain-containing protein [Allomuricauda hymeniacidonis]TAI49628.1 DUF1648 domain-containing protein [Allomuricauda hymeniacidonis]